MTKKKEDHKAKTALSASSEVTSIQDLIDTALGASSTSSAFTPSTGGLIEAVAHSIVAVDSTSHSSEVGLAEYRELFKKKYEGLSPEAVYQNSFGPVQITEEAFEDEHGVRVFIETPRFIAVSLHSPRQKYAEFSDEIQKLYEVTFAQRGVMEKFASGATKTQEDFEATVKLQSSRWGNGYKFAGFIITDKGEDIDENRDKVVGYEVIGNSAIPGMGEVAYLFNQDYHRSSGKAKGVGSECVGALVLYYGQSLFKSRLLVNQIYDQNQGSFILGQRFEGVVATSRTDNHPSSKILLKLGFSDCGKTLKFGALRHEFEKFYQESTDDAFLGLAGLAEAYEYGA